MSPKSDKGEAGSGPSKAESLRVEYVPLSKLAGAKRNPKDHDIGAMIQSLQRFGFVAPGVVNEATGRMVVGHGRAEALGRMKADGFPAPKRIKVEGGEWLIPIIRGISFASDADAEAYLLADNRLSEIGGWDHGVLPDVLRDLAEADLLDVTGFDADDLAMYGFWDSGTNERPPLPPVDESITGGGRVPARRLVLLFESEEELQSFWDGIAGEHVPGTMTYRWVDLGFRDGERDGEGE